MQKEQLRDLYKKELVYSGEASVIYRLDDGRLLKVAAPVIFDSCNMFNIRYDDKIMSNRLNGISEVVSPITAVFNGRYCCGYTMEEIQGPTLNSYDDNYTLEDKSNFNEYFELYTKVEEAVKKINARDVVIPDLCTCDNIIFTKDGSVKFIDYDGLQLGRNDVTFAISSSLGDPMYYLDSDKFCYEPFHFTPELDKTSLAILMFLWIFNMDLTKVGQVNPYSGKVMTVKDIFNYLGLKDDVFMRKIEANLSDKEKGVYLASDLHRVLENYNMIACKNDSDIVVKQLVRK